MERFKDISFVSKDASSYEEKEIEVVFVQFQKDKVVKKFGSIPTAPEFLLLKV